MAQKLDGLELARLYTSDYLKQSGEINSPALLRMYSLLLRLDKSATDDDVKSWEYGEDSSPVYEVVPQPVSESVTGTPYQPLSYEAALTRGLIPGESTLDKFGVNPEITPSSDPEDIIEQGGDIQYDAIGTAPIMYWSSSSSADVGQPIEINGLDIDGYPVTQEIISNGQNNVLLDTPLWRQFRQQNNSDSLDIQGVGYCHADATPISGVPTDANIRTIINGSHNQTLFCGYTIPRGKVGFLYRGEIGVELEGNAASLAEYAHCHYESRRYGKLFKVKKAITCLVGGNAIYQDKRSFPDVIPGLTDLKLRAITVTQTMGLWGTFDIILVDEDKFPLSYLQAIGQPGY